MFPCDTNFNLLKPVEDHEWSYMKIKYEQNYTFSGYDEAKVYFYDKSNALSRLVTIQFTVLQFPCKNGGNCARKLLLWVKVSIKVRSPTLIC